VRRRIRDAAAHLHPPREHPARRAAQQRGACRDERREGGRQQAKGCRLSLVKHTRKENWKGEGGGLSHCVAAKLLLWRLTRSAKYRSSWVKRV
jgi:hypothetical protein